MKEYSVGPNEGGQKLHKFLMKVLKDAPASFTYKMLRKKNIVLNGKKASGNELLQIGDKVTFYLSEDTFFKFAGGKETVPSSVGGKNQKNSGRKSIRKEIPILYEDENILLYNKPVGMLSQKARENDYSINEYFLDYLLDSGQLKPEQLKTFKPAVCNRLDRNTSGIILCGKTLVGLQTAGRLLQDRTLCKYYRCLVLGAVRESFVLDGYLHKDEKTNKVTICSKPFQGADEIKTSFEPIQVVEKEIQGKKFTISLLQVHLITGKTHQIRAHLSSIGHPIVGDYKYGNKKENDMFQKAYGVKSQLLHAYCLRFPVMEGALANLSEKTFLADVPSSFEKIMGGKALCQPGIPEV